ncbi:hypothetical protein PAPYR_11222 [Paratrimastix pyriformis]|uniref:Uncharacterized protein n=1 Tax=Paratrimastix pyriformis TaxID=342808 RepID=A0ABQ8U4B5_9EUKA|nr:hypothetical protein PAPYR_11222 [Paratrimastix pyriformis]
MDFSTDKHRDTVPPTNIAIPVLMMQIDEFHRKNTWDDVRTPPRKIRFLLKIHTAGMDFSTPDKHRDTVPPTNIAIPVLMMQIDEFHRKNTWDDVGTPPRKIRFLLKIHTAGMDFSTPDKHRDTVPPTNIAIPVLMMQIDEFHRKNTWDDVRTPPRKIRFLLKIHTAGMDFSTPDKHRDTGSDDVNR